jgi:hypothetical protein
MNCFEMNWKLDLKVGKDEAVDSQSVVSPLGRLMLQPRVQN